MKFTLRTMKKIYNEDTDSVEVKHGTIDCTLDTSLYAEQRWEKYFPDEASKSKLFDYVERLLNAKGEVSARVYSLSMLKAVYCFIESDDLPEFKEFAQLFDMSDEQFAIETIKKLQHMFEIALSSSATKN